MPYPRVRPATALCSTHVAVQRRVWEGSEPLVRAGRVGGACRHDAHAVPRGPRLLPSLPRGYIVGSAGHRLPQEGPEPVLEIADTTSEAPLRRPPRTGHRPGLVRSPVEAAPRLYPAAGSAPGAPRGSARRAEGPRPVTSSRRGAVVPPDWSSTHRSWHRTGAPAPIFIGRYAMHVRRPDAWTSPRATGPGRRGPTPPPVAAATCLQKCPTVGRCVIGADSRVSRVGRCHGSSSPRIQSWRCGGLLGLSPYT